MSDSLEMLRRASSSPASERGPARGPEAREEEEEVCSAFGYLRGIRERAVMVEFRFADGNSLSLPYAWLGPVQYNPSAGLLLKFVGDQVYLILIEGTNLNALVNGASLFDKGLLRQRVIWVREMPPLEVRNVRQGEITVERLRLLAHRHDEEPDAEWLQPFRIDG